MPGAATTATSPPAQPNSTTAATPKTNESETPAASSPSSGTGNRSASSIAPTKSARPPSVSADGCEAASVTAAATKAARPAAHTAVTTAARRHRCRVPVMRPLLPVEIERVQPPAQRSGEQEQQRRRDDEARSPLRHPSPPPYEKARRSDSPARGARGASPVRVNVDSEGLA